MTFAEIAFYTGLILSLFVALVLWRAIYVGGDDSNPERPKYPISRHTRGEWDQK